MKTQYYNNNNKKSECKLVSIYQLSESRTSDDNKKQVFKTNYFLESIVVVIFLDLVARELNWLDIYNICWTFYTSNIAGCKFVQLHFKNMKS